MNNYILQRLLCRTSISRCLLNNAWNYKNYAISSRLHLEQKQEGTKSEPEKWITIYKFPYILAAARVAKIRKFQYIVTCITPPVAYAFEHYELVPEQSTLLALSISNLLYIFHLLANHVKSLFISFSRISEYDLNLLQFHVSATGRILVRGSSERKHKDGIFNIWRK